MCSSYSHRISRTHRVTREVQTLTECPIYSRRITREVQTLTNRPDVGHLVDHVMTLIYTCRRVVPVRETFVIEFARRLMRVLGTHALTFANEIWYVHVCGFSYGRVVDCIRRRTAMPSMSFGLARAPTHMKAHVFLSYS